MDAARFNELQAVYHNTDYKVLREMGEHFVLRIGEHSPPADELLKSNGVQGAAFITPENPLSLQLTDEENYERCVAFERTLGAAGYQWLHATGISRDGSWPGENSYFILGLPEADALKLAAAFAQNAFLMFDLGKPTRLIWARGSAPHP